MVGNLPVNVSNHWKTLRAVGAFDFQTLEKFGRNVPPFGKIRWLCPQLQWVGKLDPRQGVDLFLFCIRRAGLADRFLAPSAIGSGVVATTRVPSSRLRIHHFRSSPDLSRSNIYSAIFFLPNWVFRSE
jgi:hypothetical protein